MKFPAWRYTSSTGARLTLTPAASRFRPAPAPGRAAASDAPLALWPICFSDSAGGTREAADLATFLVGEHQQPVCTGLARLARWSWAITPRSCDTLEMFGAKKITPPASPARIADSSDAGGLSRRTRR